MVTRPIQGHKRVLVFGSQALTLDSAALRSLHSTASNLQDSEWLFSLVRQLPDTWNSFSASLPRYRSGVSTSALDELAEWTTTGTLKQATLESLPNLILSPLVVMTHLVEYLALSESSAAFGGQYSFSEAVGFCTGFLSAVAVSLGKDAHQVREYGANAIRLATIIGGIVDAQDASDENGPSELLAAAYPNDEAAEALDMILARFPEAYKSVTFDRRRTTITTAAKTVSALQRELRAAGIITSEVSLRGRFHSAQHYADHFDDIAQYCSNEPSLRLPDASSLVSPTRANDSDGSFITSGPLHVHALRVVLLQHCNWYNSFASGAAAFSIEEIVTFGPERCVPTSMAKELDAAGTRQQTASETLRAFGINPNSRRPRPDDIAVVGMSIKVAGADDVRDFWGLLQDGDSQHREVPAERIRFETAFRDVDPNRKWFGNFINDPDVFDHKFFKKSAREASSMDPQQRWMLQCAYQALEQAGYLNAPEHQREKSVGCYIGVCAADYENNIACHAPNAFSATGNLKSFIAGKIAHYFGWTGSAMCIDTACSSSLVAVHLACKAILSGECRAALAGGVNVMTNPLWFQNLAAASFLSPTGQCKPFDESADGYCRGEGIAAVVLKRLSDALADGDQIMATIASTGVLQNQNCTPIFVPNAPSLGDLFRKVVKEAAVSPDQIGYVEAHGTGTQVGDPAEYDSIREVLGGTKRRSPIVLGSTKGLVGHTECTSGAVSLVKTVLMVQERAIPPQRSFTKANPHLNMTPEDAIEIVTRGRKWESDFRAALINNYGASGSNASMIVTQAPQPLAGRNTSAASGWAAAEVPFRLCAKDVRALRAYGEKLRGVVLQRSDVSVADLAFNICRQSNPWLESAWIVAARSREQLVDKLGEFVAGNMGAGQLVQPTPSRPVILCFGGQISTSIGLNRDVYDNVAVLRYWLDKCDEACRAIGCESIFPGIFAKDPVLDPVKLQTMLFSMQYSCARAWMNCGIQPVAVVGHSFGELTATCISGVLSLKDAVRMIAGRARVIKDLWGEEKGSMVALESDLSVVQDMLREVAAPCREAGEVGPTIACFNGPRSFTVAGSTKAIDIVIQLITKNPKYSTIRFKRLNVTNAFHSTLVEPLRRELEQVGHGLKFNQPTIAVERATEFPSGEQLSPRYIADHMRNPVYFDHAVQRLAKRHPSAVWLEAGSNSTITNMASRALGSPKDHFFQSVNITTDNGLQFLTNATMGLWGEGLSSIMFWAHHHRQTREYAPLLLPGYQFEQTRHWVEAKVPQIAPPTESTAPNSGAEPPKGLWSFSGFLDDGKRSARFRVNTMTDIYRDFVTGHIIAQAAPILPATVQVKVVVDAVSSVLEGAESGLQPRICDVENQVPVCVDPTREVYLQAQALDAGRYEWEWRMMSEKAGSPGTAATMHVSGKLVFMPPEDMDWRREFVRYERLVGHDRCTRLLQNDDADIIQGKRHIYKAFSEVVDYAEQYQGLQKLVGLASESAGRVVKKHGAEGWLDPLLADCFSQVGGIWVNCMTERHADDMFIATGFERWMRSPDVDAATYAQVLKWDIFGTHHPAESGNAWLSDLFIFDPATGKLVECILGINYHRVAKPSMRKMLTRLTNAPEVLVKPASDVSLPVAAGNDKAEAKPAASAPVPSSAPPKASRSSSSSGPSEGQAVAGKIRVLLAEIAGLEGEAISMSTELADIGIDSLMGMELARELEGLFKCSLPSDELMTIVDFGQLVRLVQTTLGVDTATDEDGDATTATDDTSDSGSSQNNAPTPPSTMAAGSRADSGSTEAQGVLEVPSSAVLEAFEETKRLTDQFIKDYRCAGYMETVLPRQTQLCIALALDALEQLGCPLRTAAPGDRVPRVAHAPDQSYLTNYLYDMLAKEARIIDMVDRDTMVRTNVSVAPYKSSESLVAGLLRDFPDHEWANRLTFFAGSRLADVITGKQDGIKLIFGTDEGRRLVAGLYGDSLLNKLANVQMQDMIARLAAKIPHDGGPLKILELGAGTGGTTKGMAAMLKRLGVPVEYTFTDLSGSFVAQARKTFKEYPFMRFRVHNIEHVPADDLLGTQHVVIASNAVHATHNLAESTTNIRKMLRPDGFLMMLEMTQPVYWVDLIFGLFEGWWLFNDGRNHAIAHQTVWERELHRSGYGHVDWTDGHLPEIEIQRVIIAMASGPRYTRQPLPPPPAKTDMAASLGPTNAHRATIDEYIATHSRDFAAPSSTATVPDGPPPTVVLVTGASGSLGTHLVAHIASLSHVSSVVCLNRRSTTEADARQQRAMEERGILPDAACLAKLQVIQTDTTKPLLGLAPAEYERLAGSVTHIIHNAWPMSGKRPLSAMANQFIVLRNLIDLAGAIASRHPPSFRVNFEFVSSIAVVGHYPLLPLGNRVVPEERMPIDAVLPNGYGEAKWICERILDETLHRYPERFRVMSVRLGQVAGSRNSGYWNPMEHLSFLIKSSQTLRAFPAFDGDVCWTPLEDVAGTLADLVLLPGERHPIYHIDNPVRQPWVEMVPVLAQELGIPRDGIIPFKQWVQRVRSFPGAVDTDNPAVRLVDFLDDNFIRMSCGGLILDTKHSCQDSPTLAAVGPVSSSVVKKYVQAWKDMGFLA